MIVSFYTEDGTLIREGNINGNPNAYIGSELDEQIVANVEVMVEPADLRAERDAVFATTLDVLNPLWWGQFTDYQKAQAIIWRQTWLDYPDTQVKPALSWEETINLPTP